MRLAFAFRSTVYRRAKSRVIRAATTGFGSNFSRATSFFHAGLQQQSFATQSRSEEEAKPEPAKPPSSPSAVPGVATATALAAVSFFAADALGSILFAGSANSISGIPVAIVLGLATNNILGRVNPSALSLLKPGLSVCSSTILRAGIICVGARLSAYDVVQLGATGVPIVAACVGTGLFFIPWLAQKMYAFIALVVIFSVMDIQTYIHHDIINEITPPAVSTGTGACHPS
mgnify:CR=1 FL=1